MACHPGVLPLSVEIAVEEGKDLLGWPAENEPGRAADGIHGEPEIMEVALGNLITEELRAFPDVLSGEIQDKTAAGFCFLAVSKKIVDDGIVLGQNSGPDGGMPQKFIYLLRGEMPQPVDFFAL